MKRYKSLLLDSHARGNGALDGPDPMGVEMGPQDQYTLVICKVMRIALLGVFLLMAGLVLAAWLLA